MREKREEAEKEHIITINFLFSVYYPTRWINFLKNELWDLYKYHKLGFLYKHFRGVPKPIKTVLSRLL